MDNKASAARATQFPIGSRVTHADLENDPYKVFAELRTSEPVSWVPVHQMYYVTKFQLCRDILADDVTFTVGFDHSTVRDTFGEHMMSVDGTESRRFKNAHRRTFMRSHIAEALEPAIRKQANVLIDGFATDGKTELRKNFASRLPILTMLELFGLKPDAEQTFRNWYDAFEAALSNTLRDPGVRETGNIAVNEFHTMMQREIDRARQLPATTSLLSTLVHGPAETRLSDPEIRRNALIVMFGGISTVEALILNTLYALSLNHALLADLRKDPGLLPGVIEETVRWLGPVQSAHRYVAKDTVVGGISLSEGSIVSCSLAAANHDPEAFENPENFDISRDPKKHIGFAEGPHLCLGMHLARAEARVALEQLFARLDGFEVDPMKPTKPFGAEFRQPPALNTLWAASHP